MIDLSKLDDVLDDVREAGNYAALSEAGQLEFDKLLELSSVPEVLDKYLSWHGIVNYTEQILTALETICAADSNNPAHLCEKMVAHYWDAEYQDYMSVNNLDDDEDDVIQHAADSESDHIFCTLARLHLANNQSF